MPGLILRVSFANLNDGVYDDIGRAVSAAGNDAQAYQSATGKTETAKGRGAFSPGDLARKERPQVARW